MGWDQSFASRVESGDLTIGVVGLGYVGLPTALGFLEAGFRVRGIDVSERVISMLQAGENPGDDPQHDEVIPSSESDSWRVGMEYSELLSGCDVILVTVPTPVTIDRAPDVSYIQSAGESIFNSIPKDEGTLL